MTDYDFEAIAKGIELVNKARAAVAKRRHTDRIGSRWSLGQAIGSVEGEPEFCGTKGKARISYSECGTKYEVQTYTYAGKRLNAPVYRKTLDSAFRVGEKLTSA